MSREPDIKLLFGVEGGASIDQGSGKQIFDDLKEIVKGINGKDALKVKVGLDDGSAKEFKEQIKGIMSGADSGVEVKVAGLDKTASDAGKTAKALDSVAASAKKVGQAAKESSGGALTKGTREYNDALTKINTLLIQLRNNQRNWSAASKGDGLIDHSRIQNQVVALQVLEKRLVSGELTAEDFADELSRIRSVATDAAESINKLGENHSAVEVLTKDTREYNDALTKSYTLLGQIYTNQSSWTKAATGVSAGSYASLGVSAADLSELIEMLRTGKLDAKTFSDVFSDIKANVTEAGTAIKAAGENMKAVVSAETTTRLAQVNAELKEIAVQNDTLTTQYRKITSQGSIDGVDATQVDALKVKFQELLRQTELLKANRKTATDDDIAGVRQLQAEVLRLTTVINGQTEAAKKASAENKDANKTQMASLKEVVTLYEHIDKYLLKNSRAEGTSQYDDLKKIRDGLYAVKQATNEANNGMTNLSKADMKALGGQVRNLESELRDAGKEGNTLIKTITAAYQKFGGWMLVTQSLTKVVSGLRQMVENVKQIDIAMTELKKVTNETSATYDRFLTNAQARASQLGATVSDVVSAAADFARLGYSIGDASALADAALVYKNVGDGITDISTASESIISTMQAFGYEANQAMLVVDKFNQVGNRYAISSSGLGEALVRSAAAMASANNTLDETIALATAANTILQNPTVVGTTMKTMSMFLRAAKTEAEEAGESTDGMANSVSELRSEILALTGNRVDIQIDEDNFKSTYQILKEMSQVWDDLSDISQANILEMIGGKRNANAVAAILENFNIAERALKDSVDSAGAALAENEKYLDSIAGKAARFKAAFESLSVEVIDSETVGLFVDAGTALVNLVTQLQKMGLLLPSLVSLVGVFTGIKKSVEIGNLAGKIVSAASAFDKTSESTTRLKQTIAALSGQSKKLLLQQVEQALVAGNVDDAQRQQIISTLALDKAQDGLAVSSANVGASFLNMVKAIPKWQLAIMAITTVVSVVGAIKDRVEQARQEAIDAADEISRAYSEAQNNCESNIDALNNLRERYNELSKSVGENGENISLTSSQYDEYLSLVRQIADISPDIVNGFTSETAAVASYNDAVQTAIDSQKEFLQHQTEIYLGGGQQLFDGAKSKYDAAIGSILDSTYYMSLEYADSESATRYLFDNLGITIDPNDVEGAARIIHENRNRILSAYKDLGYNTDEMQVMLYKLSEYFTQIDGVNAELSEYLKVWGENNNWFDGISENTAAMNAVMGGLSSIIDYDAGLYENIGNAESFVSSFIDSINSAEVANIVAMSDGLADGTVTIEAYNAAIASLRSAWSGSPEIMRVLTDYLGELSNKYTDASAATDGARISFKALSDVLTEETNEAIDGVQTNITTLQGALEKLGNGELGANDVIDLLQQFPELAPYIDLTAENFGNLADGLEEAIRNSPKELVKDLKELVASGELTEEAAEAVSGLAEYLENIPNTSIKDVAEEFGVLKDAIKSATKAHSELEKSLAEPDYDTNYSSRVEAFESFKESYKAGEYGSKAYAAYKEFFGLDGKTTDQIGKWIEKNNKYFSEGTTGIINFLHTVADLDDAGEALDGIASFNKTTGEFWYDINALNSFADALGWTEEMLQDFIDKYRMYCDTWESRSPQENITEFLNAGIITDSDGWLVADLQKLIDYTGLSIDEIHKLIQAMNDLRKQEGLGLIRVSKSENIERIHSQVVSAAKNIQNNVFSGKVVFDAEVRLPDDISDEIAEKVSIEVPLIIDGEQTIASVSATEERIEDILGHDWQIQLDSKDAEKQMAALLKLCESLTDDEYTLEFDDNTGTVFEDLRALIDYLKYIEANKTQTVTVHYKYTGKPGVGGGEVYTPYAAGTSGAKKGLALLGDEKSPNGTPKPELVVSDGEAYIAGISGPEIRHLDEGDVVYTADETKKILGRHRSGVTIPAHAGGTAPALGSGGPSSGAGSPSAPSIGDTKKPSTNSFEDLYSYHKHLLELERESLEDYLKWLSAAYKKAYKDGKIELQDYYDYEEEVFRGLNDLHNNYIQDLEHQIFLLEEQGASAEEIITLYKQMMQSVGDEIERLRSEGLNDNSDTIQDLQKQWWEYHDAIVGIQESIAEEAKQAYDSLTQDLEHQIFLLEEQGASAEEIIALYKRMMEATNAEAERLRSEGLNDNSDTIQDLQKQWWEYHDAIVGIQESIAEEAISAYRDAVNDIEHQIVILEQHAGANNEIIALYRQMMAMAHEEAERLRDAGYDDTSDEIQELQQQWWEYYNAIADMEEDTAKNAKSAAEELVEYRIGMLKQELEEQKDSLNEQLDQLKSFYDKQKDMLREQHDEKKYLEEQAEKRKSVSELEEEKERLRFDDSAWAQKRKAEIESELEDAKKELSDFEEDHALDEAEKLLDEQFKKQESLIQTQIEAIDAQLNDPEALFNKALSDIQNNTAELYQEMVEFNAANGSGNPDDILEMWQEAYAALEEYLRLFGEAYKGIVIDSGWAAAAGITGYATGTRSATAGPHQFGERGPEMIFTSADGGRYRIFSDGEKVLNADATDFLYDFANSQGHGMKSVWDSLVGSILQQVGGIGAREASVEISTGDIVIQGNADERTVSEIRRSQREQVSYILKEFRRFNK